MGHSETGKRVAVLLNANARRVTDSVQAKMAKAAPDAEIVLSNSQDDTKDFVRKALAGGYDRIVSGGGDGTLVTVASMIRNEVASLRASGSKLALPELAVLKLGTGNAVADVLSAGDPVKDLRQLANLPDVPSTRLDLLEVENVSAPFCGFGYDALVLNDYVRQKKWAQRAWLKPLFEGVRGYLLAAFTRSIPKTLWRQIRRKRTVARVLNESGKVYRVSYSHGLVPVDVKPGGVFYSGPVTMLSAGTIPYYGFRFTMFPFARILPGYAHLRVARAGVWEAARNLRRVWNGTFASPTVEDFLVEKVRIRFNEPMPFQVGGDAAGYRKEVVLGVHEEPFQVFDMGEA